MAVPPRSNHVLRRGQATAPSLIDGMDRAGVMPLSGLPLADSDARVQLVLLRGTPRTVIPTGGACFARI